MIFVYMREVWTIRETDKKGLIANEIFCTTIFSVLISLNYAVKHNCYLILTRSFS